MTLLTGIIAFARKKPIEIWMFEVWLAIALVEIWI